VCLVGILVGTLLRVRSYLFLGVVFFTLDIVANLVQEGLQNQFVGFILLTFAGLLLIAVLILYNLKGDQIKAVWQRLVKRFARWQ
jgi:cell division protein FtsX